MRSNLFAIVLATLAVGACSEEPEVKKLTYTKIFSGETSKTWVIEQVVLTENGEVSGQIGFSACELDDRYTFNADEEKSFVISNGGLACSPEEGDIYLEDTWAFVNAGAILNIAVPRLFGDFVVPFIVREISNDRMTLEIFADAENTISYQIVMESVD